MSRAARVDMPVDHRRLVLSILAAHVPAGSAAWVFGSRATGRARPHSDLDLAIDAGRRLTLDECASLAEAFSESNLPYRVDLVDWRAIDESFRRIVAADRVLLTPALSRAVAAAR